MICSVSYISFVFMSLAATRPWPQTNNYSFLWPDVFFFFCTKRSDQSVMSTLAAAHFGTSPNRNILLQSGCNFLMPITKCWFGISGFLWLAAVSDFSDSLFKEACWGFPVINNYTLRKKISLLGTYGDILYLRLCVTSGK